MSPFTSPQSFHTAAPASQSSLLSSIDTPILSTPPIAAPAPPRAREVRPLPYELRHHTQIYLEEQLYASALTLLDSLLISGLSTAISDSPNASNSRILAPPSSHLALASTLLIHPSTTTRPTSGSQQISSRALSFLRNTLEILPPGTRESPLCQAFVFEQHSNRHARGNGRARLRDTSSEDSEDEGNIHSALAREQSIWASAQDFWAVVGWALNCSVCFKKRWKYYEVWLKFMLDVLERDWEERARQCRQEAPKDDGTSYKIEVHSDPLADSLLMQYLTSQGTRTPTIKRIVKSIFVDGSSETLRMFPEIFLNETKELKRPRSSVDTAYGSKRAKDTELDIDREQYGDYMNDDEDSLYIEPPSDPIDTSSPPASQPEAGHADTPSSSDTAQTAPSSMSNPTALTLRLRLLALLSRAADARPSLFIPLLTFYNHIYDLVRPLPVPIFTLFLSPSTLPVYPAAMLSSLAQLFLSRLQATAAPRLTSDDLTQEILEQVILPYAANTGSVEDNAKLSLLCETLLRVFVGSCGVPDSVAALGAAVEEGIQARLQRVAAERKRKTKREGWDRDLAAMEASAWRMRMLVTVLEKQHGRSSAS